MTTPASGELVEAVKRSIALLDGDDWPHDCPGASCGICQTTLAIVQDLENALASHPPAPATPDDWQGLVERIARFVERCDGDAVSHENLAIAEQIREEFGSLSGSPAPATQADERGLSASGEDWQPIETAPKDGTLVLFYTPNNSPPYSTGPASDYWKGGWWLGATTDWMPLHPPFNASKEGEDGE